LFEIGGMAYTQAELATMLIEVQAAISKCLTAQEYSAGAGLGLKRATLEQLQAREKWILAEEVRLAALESGSSKNLARFPRPR
jgi:hypothetical protein